MEAAIAYLHFISAFLVAAFLVTEFFLCGVQQLLPAQVKTLARVDLYYLFAAAAVLVTGALRVFAVGKGAAFYLNNPVFYIKVALFLAVGLVSIPPTLQFMRWKRALNTAGQRAPTDRDAGLARRYIALELVLLAFIPLMAVLMARGIGPQR
jgi:putative membrane protein